MNAHAVIGLGDPQAVIKLYIQNKPPMPEYQTLATVNALSKGEIYRIGQLTGNHWRKIFNVYAKLIFELQPGNFSSWQQFRDEQLLQAGSRQSLLFNKPNLSQQDGQAVNIIIGKTYALQLFKTLPAAVNADLHWLNEDFAISVKFKVIICPYFDYRQLSNVKISRLVAIIKALD